MSNAIPTRLIEVGEVQTNAQIRRGYQAQSKVLEAECRTFARYLVRQQPNDFVMAKYCDAHEKETMFYAHKLGAFDRYLLTIAQLGPVATKFADTYAAMFCRGTVLRRKVILLLAILESCAPTYRYFEEPETNQTVALYARLIGQGILFSLLLVAATLLLLPLQLLLTKRMDRE